jgi:hypothetical protein
MYDNNLNNYFSAQSQQSGDQLIGQQSDRGQRPQMQIAQSTALNNQGNNQQGNSRNLSSNAPRSHGVGAKNKADAEAGIFFSAIEKNSNGYRL